MAAQAGKCGATELETELEKRKDEASRRRGQDKKREIEDDEGKEGQEEVWRYL